MHWLTLRNISSHNYCIVAVSTLPSPGQNDRAKKEK